MTLRATGSLHHRELRGHQYRARDGKANPGAESCAAVAPRQDNSEQQQQHRNVIQQHGLQRQPRENQRASDSRCAAVGHRTHDQP
jgi:hypothetical protein